MKNLKTRFTLWYIRRGYEYGYTNALDEYYICPKWVKLLNPFLFSRRVYTIEKLNRCYRTWVIKTHDDGYGAYQIKHCPDCDRGLPVEYDADYCPKCGAKMDGGKK